MRKIMKKFSGFTIAKILFTQYNRTGRLVGKSNTFIKRSYETFVFEKHVRSYLIIFKNILRITN
jgi:hypothetical protein